MKAKPFIKWVGGKGQLIEQLEALLPADFDRWENVTYIEPFVGGGAILFHILNHHPEIRRAVVNDINPYLVTTYRVIKERPKELIKRLALLENKYYSLAEEESQLLHS